MAPYNISTCPRAILEFALSKLFDNWIPNKTLNREAVDFQISNLYASHKLERKKTPEPIPYAGVRWFSNIDEDSDEPAGYFLAAWRISRFGDISGPFYDVSQDQIDAKNPSTIVTELKINFSFGDQLCALELISPCGDVERLVRRFDGFDSAALGDVIGEVRRDWVTPNTYLHYFPKGWQMRS